MATYEFGLDCLNDALFRASEPTDRTSDYDNAAKDYIQRVYWDCYSYAPWPWAKKYPPGVVDLAAEVTGTADFTKDSTTVTLSAAISTSMTNRKIKADNEGVPYRVAAHTAGATTLTIDATYKEATASAVAFTIFQDEYQLVTGANGAIRPFGFWYRNRPSQVFALISEEEQRASDGWLYTSANYIGSIAMITENRFRIRPWPVDAKTLEYDYAERQSVLDFTGAGAGDTPAVPRDDRQVLSDWALFYLQTDKKDPDAGTHLIMAKNKLEQMQAKYLPQIGRRLWIRPRQTVGGRV